MSPTIEVEIATIALWNCLALGILVAAFIVLYTKANHKTPLKIFFLVQLALGIWLGGKVLKTVSPNVELRWFFIVFYYFGICLCEASFFDFSYAYGTGRVLKKPYRMAVYGIALLQFLAMATNPYHHKFYSYYDFSHDEFGPLFYIHTVIVYLFLVWGMVLCSRKFRKNLAHTSGWKRYFIACIILFPIIMNLIYVTRTLEALFDFLHIQVFDITPIVFTWSILCFVYATFRYDFFDLMPLMKHEVVNRLDTPLAIVCGNSVVYGNRRFQKTFYEKEDPSQMTPAGQLPEELPQQLLQQLHLSQAQPKAQRKAQPIAYKNKYFLERVEHLNSHDSLSLITLTDITAYQKLVHQVTEESKRLAGLNTKLEHQIALLKASSHVGASTYVAGELHDIMGHSLVLSLKLLETLTVGAEKEATLVQDVLAKAYQAVESGFAEMKEVYHEESHRRVDLKFFDTTMRQMLKVVEASGLEVHYYQSGENVTLPQCVFDGVRKVCTELITNTLKHGHASRLLVTINYVNAGLHVHIMDNGVGVHTLQRGNGLQGIEHRIHELGGKVSFSSSTEEGFSCSLMVPL